MMNNTLEHGKGVTSGWILVFAGFLAVAVFLLAAEHRAGAFGYVLHALTALCIGPLLLNIWAHPESEGEPITPKDGEP